MAKALCTLPFVWKKRFMHNVLFTITMLKQYLGKEYYINFYRPEEHSLEFHLWLLIVAVLAIQLLLLQDWFNLDFQS